MSYSASLSELDILLDELELGRWVYPYVIKSPSRTLDERAKQQDRTWQRLRADGLAGPRGLDADFEALLRAWVRPDVLFTHTASIIDPPDDYLYRGGWQGDVGFLSQQQGDRLKFDALRPDQVIPALLNVLPDWPPIQSAPVTLLTEPDGQPTGGNTSTLRAAEHFLAGPMLRYGLITCSRREPDTYTHRGEHVELGAPAWFDTKEGRFFVVAEKLPDGAERKTFTPADTPRLATWLRDRLSDAPEP